MDVRLPDGTIIQGVPEGTTKADLAAKLQRNGMAVPSEWLGDRPAEPSIAEQAGAWLRETPGKFARQVGLTARYGIEGLAQAAELGTEPIRNLVVNPIARALQPTTTADLITGKQPLQARPLSQSATAIADWLGLPSPQTANERVIGDATRLMAGAGGMTGGAQTLARGATGLTQTVLQGLASNPAQQWLGAGGSGLAGGSVREAGGSPLEQAAASVLGGVAAPLATNGAARVATGVQGLARKAAAAVYPAITPVPMQQVDQQIALTLKGSGVNWQDVPERIKQGMREEAAQALASGGQLNADALRRLVDFRTTGVTPTRGMLTQDPVQITRERNLAKVGANSTDIGLQALPGLENRNTLQLLNLLDDAGAKGAPDSYATGQRLLEALGVHAAQRKAEIGGLYSAARDSAGRSAALDGAHFTRTASQLLDEKLLGYAVPSSVEQHLNRIARGEVPFTVDYAEQLKTAMGDIARADKGGATSKAMGAIRQALDNTPLASAPTVNPGNLPALPGTVPPSPGVMGREAISAFNAARRANASWMQQIERTPALQAALDGADPDQFVKRFVLGQGASANDVRALRAAAAADPAAMQAVKQNIVAHLRSAATGGAEDVTKFSSHAFGKAMDAIGEQKLVAFFAPDEIAQLQAIKRTSTLMQSQPAGSAVNNSNTGGLLIGRAMDVLDRIAGKLPAGLDTTIHGVLRGVQQRQALSVPAGLLAAPLPAARRPVLLPGLTGGLLAAQPVDHGQ